MKRPIHPSLWASWKPFGIGEQHPNNFGEVSRAIWENRDQAGYAWRITRRASATAARSAWPGCTTGRSTARTSATSACGCCASTRWARSIRALLADVAAAAARPSAELRELGRLPYPMCAARGEPGFTRIRWDEALDLVAERIRATRSRIGSPST